MTSKVDEVIKSRGIGCLSNLRISLVWLGRTSYDTCDITNFDVAHVLCHAVPCCALPAAKIRDVWWAPGLSACHTVHDPWDVAKPESIHIRLHRLHRSASLKDVESYGPFDIDASGFNTFKHIILRVETIWKYMKIYKSIGMEIFTMIQWYLHVLYLHIFSNEVGFQNPWGLSNVTPIAGVPSQRARGWRWHPTPRRVRSQTSPQQVEH